MRKKLFFILLVLFIVGCDEELPELSLAEAQAVQITQVMSCRNVTQQVRDIVPTEFSYECNGNIDVGASFVKCEDTTLNVSGGYDEYFKIPVSLYNRTKKNTIYYVVDMTEFVNKSVEICTKTNTFIITQDKVSRKFDFSAFGTAYLTQDGIEVEHKWDSNGDGVKQSGESWWLLKIEGTEIKQQVRNSEDEYKTSDTSFKQEKTLREIP